MTSAYRTADSEEILDRAVMRANNAMFTVDMQIRRVKSSEPEDAVFLGRKIADIEFLIVAAIRIRRAATLATNANEVRQILLTAREKFDRKLPALKKLRDVAEHIDDYSSDQGHDQNVDRALLENCSVTDAGQTWTWLGNSINVNDVRDACSELLQQIVDARKSLEAA